MAYIIIPAPSSVSGPCVEQCSHTDCAEMRRDVATVCHSCGKPNGYGVKLCAWGKGLGHWLCCLKENEPKKPARGLK